MKSDQSFKVALVGRPNVGKSTLFNKIIGKQMAIVNDTPGVTRDYRESPATIQGQDITLIDTAGLENDRDEQSMFGRMRKQTEAAVDIADMLVFIVDGRAGITPMDEHFAKWIRKIKKPKLLVVNKCEGRASDLITAEAHRLGFGQPLPMAAEHGQGFFELYQEIINQIPEDLNNQDDDINAKISESNEPEEGDEDYEFVDIEKDTIDQKPLKVAIVGRPNVGKSTLVNCLLEQDRVMTGPEAGVTRDAIAVDWNFKGRDFKLVDTAGLRKQNKVVDKIEKLSVDNTMTSIRLAQMVVLVLDGTLGIDKQDLMIAAHAIEEGRGLIIAVNKWDAVEDRQARLKEILGRLELSLGQVRDIPIQTLSALSGRNTDTLMDRLLETYDVWNGRVSTGKLNRWLQAIYDHHPPPLYKGRPNRLRYMAQINTRPPTFALWLSAPKQLPESYKRYMMNSLREYFELPGVPIRLLLRTSKNPYAK